MSLQRCTETIVLRTHTLPLQNLAQLESKSSVVVRVQFLPTVTGLQALRGVACVDVRSGQEFPQDDPLAHLLVRPPSSAGA